MGCDIHFYVERKIDGIWHGVNPPDQGDEFGESLSCLNKYRTEYPEDYPEGGICDWYIGRDYNLFSALADVRSSHPGNTPIKEPVGLPEDISKAVKAEADQWEGDGHSASFYTLAELQEVGDLMISHTGVVSVEEACKLKLGVNPNFIRSWSGMISGKGIVVLHWNLDEWIDAHKYDHLFGKRESAPTVFSENMTFEELLEWSRGKERPYIQMRWSQKNQSFGRFQDTVVNEMERLGNPEDVRCVFWFDN